MGLNLQTDAPAGGACFSSASGLAATSVRAHAISSEAMEKKLSHHAHRAE